MNEKVDRRKKLTKYKDNPFLSETVAQIEMGTKRMSFGTGNRIIDEYTGEVLGEAAFKQVRMVDKSKFVKVYVAMQTAFFQLSKKAQKVLMVVFHEVSSSAINRDEIYLNWEIAEDFFTDNNVSCGRTSFFGGVSELIDKMIIAESTRTNLYFINPTMIFNGDRATFIQQIVKTNQEVKKEGKEKIAKRSLDAMKSLSGEKINKISNELKFK